MYGVWFGEITRGQKRPFAARITGTDTKYGFRREFMRGYFDYSYKRGRIYFPLPPGIYDVFEPLQGKRHYRAFIRVQGNGEWDEISRDEVLECLKKSISE